MAVASAVLLLLAMAAAAPAGTRSACVAVDGDEILGRHVAGADPRFAFLARDYRIGYVPLPGGKRILTPRDLDAIARRAGATVAGNLRALCFEYPTRTLEAGELIAAVRRFAGTQSVEVLDYSRYPVATGEIEILSAVPARGGKDGARLFRGRVRYGDRRTQSIWVKAACRFEFWRVVARAPLAAGQPIDAGQLELVPVETAGEVPDGAAEVAPLDGLAPRKPVAAGARIDPRNLFRPADIQRGDRVEVEVRRGQARVSIASAAESSGRCGDTILLRNPETGRRFRARVAGKGKAAITTGGNECD